MNELLSHRTPTNLEYTFQKNKNKKKAYSILVSFQNPHWFLQVLYLEKTKQNPLLLLNISGNISKKLREKKCMCC